MRRVIFATLVVAGFAAWGCGRREPAPQSAPATVTLRIINDNLMHVDVFAVIGTSRESLAHVCDLGEAFVDIGPQLLAGREISLLAVAVETADTFQTPVIRATGPTAIELLLAKEWKNSTYRVRAGNDTNTTPLPLRMP